MGPGFKFAIEKEGNGIKATVLPRLIFVRLYDNLPISFARSSAVKNRASKSESARLLKGGETYPNQ